MSTAMEMKDILKIELQGARKEIRRVRTNLKRRIHKQQQQGRLKLKLLLERAHARDLRRELKRLAR
jgi:hypothetical protein